MQIKVERYGHAVILNCKGELTEDTLEVFCKEVTRQLDENIVDIVVSLQELGFIDSAALTYLLELQETLRDRQGQLSLAKPNENVLKILEITRLDGELDVVDDIMEAVRAI